MLGTIVTISLIATVAFLLHNAVTTYLSGEEISLGQAIRELKEREVSFRDSLDI